MKKQPKQKPTSIVAADGNMLTHGSHESAFSRVADKFRRFFADPDSAAVAQSNAPERFSFAPMASIFFECGGAEPQPLGDPVIQFLARARPQELHDLENIQSMMSDLPTPTDKQLFALLGLFRKREDDTTDYEAAALLVLDLHIGRKGTISVALKDIVPYRVFRAVSTLRKRKLKWYVYDEAYPLIRVNCDSLDEVVDGLFAIAIVQKGAAERHSANAHSSRPPFAFLKRFFGFKSPRNFPR